MKKGDIVHYEWHGTVLKGKVVGISIAGGKTIYHVI
jgi:hypothetical protein